MSRTRAASYPGFWLVFAACVACGAQTPGQVAGPRARGGPAPIIASFSPDCAGTESLEEELAPQVALLQQTTRKLNLELSLLRPREVAPALKRPRDGFLLYVYSGHGKNDLGKSVGCYPPESGQSGELVFDQLVRQLPTSLKGATFVINACESAYVDPRGPVPVSVISASPFVVATDSLFGHFLPEALEFAATDPNCDGLVTDRELFEALTALLAQAPAMSFRPAFPKLRRNANSDIPLPIKPAPQGRCAKERQRVGQIVRAGANDWGPLGAALLRQLKLADDPTQDLPESAADYFLITGAGDADDLARVEQAAREAGLEPLPASARTHAPELARFAIFTEIYELSLSCGFVRVTDLRRGELLATKPSTELSPVIPRRVSLQSPPLSPLNPLRRIVGKVSSEVRRPRPCYGNYGQCFEATNEP